MPKCNFSKVAFLSKYIWRPASAVTPEEYNTLKKPNHRIFQLKFRIITSIHLHWSSALMLMTNIELINVGKGVTLETEYKKGTRHLSS